MHCTGHAYWTLQTNGNIITLFYVLLIISRGVEKWWGLYSADQFWWMHHVFSHWTGYSFKNQLLLLIFYT